MKIKQQKEKRPLSVFIFCFLAILFSPTPPALADIYLLQDSYTQSRKGIWKPFNKNVIEQKQTTRAIGLAGDLPLGNIVYDIRYIELSNDSHKPHRPKKHDLKVQSLYQDIDINDNWSMRVGKFVENWQLGYEFNPLAVVDPYRENSSLSNPLGNKTGLHALSINYVGNDSSTTFYIGDDDAKKDIIANQGNRYIAIKHSQIISDNTDITLVSQKKKSGKIGIGAGFRQIVNDALAIHGSLFVREGTGLGIHQGVYDNNPHFIATTNPIGQYRLKDSTLYPRLMLGMQYTTSNDVNVIVEFGYDKRRMDSKQWRTYKKMVKNHAAITHPLMLPIKTPNMLWDMSIITPNGIRQNYMMARISKEWGAIELNSLVRMGIDKSALWRSEIKYTGLKGLTAGAYLTTTLGGGDTEYGKFFAYKERLNVYFRQDF